jgi:hypothetical protein
VPRAKEATAELDCNECGIVEGSVDGAILGGVVTSGIVHGDGGCSGDIVVAGSGEGKWNCGATNAGLSPDWSTLALGGSGVSSAKA